MNKHISAFLIMIIDCVSAALLERWRQVALIFQFTSPKIGFGTTPFASSWQRA